MYCRLSILLFLSFSAALLAVSPYYYSTVLKVAALKGNNHYLLSKGIDPVCSSSTPIIKAEKRKKEIREKEKESLRKKNSTIFLYIFFLGRLWIVRDNPIDSGITVAFPGSILHTQMRWEMRGKKTKEGLRCIFQFFFLFILISKGLFYGSTLNVVGAPFDTNPSLSFWGSWGEENRRDIFPLMWLVNYSTYYITKPALGFFFVG